MSRATRSAVAVQEKGKGKGKDGVKGRDTGKGMAKDKGKQDALYVYVAKHGCCVCVVAYDSQCAKFQSLPIGHPISLHGISLRIGQPGCLFWGSSSLIERLPVGDVLSRTMYNAADFYSYGAALAAVAAGKFVDLLVYVASVEVKSVASSGESYLEIWCQDSELAQVGPLRLWRFRSVWPSFHVLDSIFVCLAACVRLSHCLSLYCHGLRW